MCVADQWRDLLSGFIGSFLWDITFYFNTITLYFFFFNHRHVMGFLIIFNLIQQTQKAFLRKLCKEYFTCKTSLSYELLFCSFRPYQLPVYIYIYDLRSLRRVLFLSFMAEFFRLYCKGEKKVKKISYIHTGGILLQEICLSVRSTTIPSENSCTYQ